MRKSNRTEINGIPMKTLMENAHSRIVNAQWFPYHFGHLKTDATILEQSGYRITFYGSIAHYIDFLEYGTRPHTYISKNGKVVNHPGSTKHVGFIRDKSVSAVLNEIMVELGGKEVF